MLQMGVKGAKEIYKNMVKYLKKGDNRWPKQELNDDEIPYPERLKDKEKFEGLLGIVTKKIE